MKLGRSIIGVAVGALFFCGGCGRAEKQITELQRKEAAHLASEADFAHTMRDYAREESVLSKVVVLCPDTGTYWINLGASRARLGNRSRAKDAYESGLRAFEAEAKKNPTDADPWLKRVYVLALLGRVDESRALVVKAAKQFPADRAIRRFIEEKQFEQMLSDPSFKQEAL